MSYRDMYLATKPVLFLPLDDAAGSATVKDASGNGHDGTCQGTCILGSASVMPGDTGSCLQLNGAGQVAVPTLGLKPPFSLVTVIAPTLDAGPNTGFASAAGFASNRRLLWADIKNGLRPLAQMGAASLSGANGSMPAGQAAHLVYTNDGTTETIYVDGSVVGSQPNATATWDSPFFLGAYGPYNGGSGSYMLIGALQDFGVNNTCLDAATVAALSRAAFTVPPVAPGITPLVWDGSKWVPTALKMFLGSQAPAGQAANDVWIKVT